MASPSRCHRHQQRRHGPVGVTVVFFVIIFVFSVFGFWGLVVVVLGVVGGALASQHSRPQPQEDGRKWGGTQTKSAAIGGEAKGRNLTQAEPERGIQERPGIIRKGRRRLKRGDSGKTA